MRPRASEPTAGGVDPLSSDDPVAAVLRAHQRGEPLLLRTSGSTAGGRVVRRTTASWFDSFDHVARLTGLGEGSRVWVPGPPAGTMNLFASVMARALGATTVGSAREATHAHLTPSELRRLVDEGRPAAGLRATVAGDRLDPALRDRATDAGLVVSHYYGAAELSFVAWGTASDDLQPFPRVDVRCRDGVLWVRSPYLAQVALDPDGFATCGDHGEVTEGGRVVVHGRGAAAVVTGGVTVHVEEVEAALRPVVRGDVVVVGLPHADLGEVVAAVLGDDADVAPAHDRARDALLHAHRPRIWFAAQSLPRTAAGKVDRAAVRDAAMRGTLRRVAPAGSR